MPKNWLRNFRWWFPKSSACRGTAVRGGMADGTHPPWLTSERATEGSTFWRGAQPMRLSMLPLIIR